jgi:tryptophan-rich sensory protein
MSCAALVGVGGWYAIHLNKEIAGKPHLTTYHSWTGIACLAMFVLGAIGSYFALHPEGGKMKSNDDVRRVHRLSLRFAVALAFVTIFSGFSKIAGALASGALGAGLGLLAFSLLL